MAPLNTIGLFIAFASSVANVITDVARKKALRNNPLLQVSRCTQSPEIAQNGCFTALKHQNLPW
jgi:hypothetical protein